MINYNHLAKFASPDMIDSVRNYIQYGYPTGSFLTALFENNFIDCYKNADENNLSVMREWASFLYNEAPLGCWGSKEKMSEWRKELMSC